MVPTSNPYPATSINTYMSLSLFTLTRSIDLPMRSCAERKMAEEGKDTEFSALVPFLSSETVQPEEENGNELMVDKVQMGSNKFQKKYGGWKTLLFILGNDSFERLASNGLTANFMVYLTKELHLKQVFAVNMLNIWNGVNNVVPLVGAFISDAYVGRFLPIAVGSFLSLVGMIALSLTSWFPELHPPHCTAQQLAAGDCVPPNNTQLGVLITALVFLSLGSGGIRPCSAPFGTDQFDPSTEEGKRQLGSFFNLYYATFTVIIILSQTVVVYIQDSVSWKWGFAIPTACMFCSIILFFLGTSYYVYVKPHGSILSSFAQVFVAAYKKRKIKLPAYSKRDGAFYEDDTEPILPYTNQFNWLSKAAVIAEGDYIKPDGIPMNKWTLCSIQQVEEVKCILRTIPIGASGILSYLTLIQQGTFIVSQALKMDRHLGPNFQIPAASMGMISYLTLVLWIPIYDRLVVPALRRITKHEGGITILQRIGVGIVLSILTMLVSGIIEKFRRDSANMHPNPLGVAPMSVMWLAPQLVLMGFCEALYIIGLIEFFNREFPERFKTLGNSLFSCSMAGASYVGTILVIIIHKTTKTDDHTDWLANDINKGRLDYYFYIIAALGFLNLLFFVFCAKRYHYKGIYSAHVVPNL